MHEKGYLQTTGKIGNFDGQMVPLFAKIIKQKHNISLKPSYPIFYARELRIFAPPLGGRGCVFVRILT